MSCQVFQIAYCWILQFIYCLLLLLRFCQAVPGYGSLIAIVYSLPCLLSVAVCCWNCKIWAGPPVCCCVWLYLLLHFVAYCCGTIYQFCCICWTVPSAAFCCFSYGIKFSAATSVWGICSLCPAVMPKIFQIFLLFVLLLVLVLGSLKYLTLMEGLSSSSWSFSLQPILGGLSLGAFVALLWGAVPEHRKTISPFSATILHWVWITTIRSPLQITDHIIVNLFSVSPPSWVMEQKHFLPSIAFPYQYFPYCLIGFLTPL